MIPTRNVLLVTGGLPEWCAANDRVLLETLQSVGYRVTHTTDSNALKSLGGVDVVVVHTWGDRFDESQIAELTAFVRGGGGLVGVHTAAASNKKSDAWARLLGSRFTTHPDLFNFNVVVDREHPIGHRVPDFRVDDELYILQQHADYRPFQHAYWNGKRQVLAYTRDEGKGKVAYVALGHTAAQLGLPENRKMLVRAARFVAGEDWSTRTINVAAIGYGGAFNMGKRHLEGCKAARLTPVAVTDLDPARTATAKAELGEHIRTYDSVDRLLADDAVEMCIVITPHNTHAALSIQCLEAGRHVVTEKPYTITIDEATRVIETARRVGKMATVFHNRRWDGFYRQIKRLVDEGAIGKVFHIDAFMGGFHEPKTDWWRSYKDLSGGVIYDWGAHITDWILQLMPHKIAGVAGDFQKRRWAQVSNEDFAVAEIRFDGGQTARLEISSISAIGKSALRILGTEGGIELKGMWDKAEGIKLVQWKNGSAISSKVEFLTDDWEAFYRNVADHLLLHEPLAVTPESARKVIAVLSLAEQSGKQGGAVLALPFEQ